MTHLSLANGNVRLAASVDGTQIVVIGTGHWRGEGMAVVEAIK
jgi:hypothetical protein